MEMVSRVNAEARSQGPVGTLSGLTPVVAMGAGSGPPIPAESVSLERH